MMDLVMNRDIARSQCLRTAQLACLVAQSAAWLTTTLRMYLDVVLCSNPTREVTRLITIVPNLTQ